MTPKQFNDLLDALGIVSSADAADRLGINSRSLRRMRAGTEAVPKVVELALRALLAEKRARA